MKKHLPFGCLAVLVATTVSFSQVQRSNQQKLAQTGLKFLSVTTDARAGAMGEAFTSLQSPSAAMFFNPAGMARLEGLANLSFGKVNWIADIDYTFGSAAFRPFDGLFLAESRKDDAYFVEVQFKKGSRFYARFFAEIYVYLAQFPLANDWRAVAIFPRRALDPGVPRHYRELFAEGRVLRIYLDELPKATLQQFPLNLLQIILDKKQNVLSTVEKITRRLPAEMPEAAAQENFIELMVNLLLNKFPELTRGEIEKMVEPLLSNVKKSRFYRELKEETAQELTPKIAQESKREIARELLLRKMSLEFIVEVTRLSPKEVRGIMKEVASRKNKHKNLKYHASISS